MNWFRTHQNKGALLHESLPLTALVSFTHIANDCLKFHLLCTLLRICLMFQEDRRVALLLEPSWLGSLCWTEVN